MTIKLFSQVKEQQLTFLRNLKGTVFSMVVITLDLPGRLFNSQRRHWQDLHIISLKGDRAEVLVGPFVIIFPEETHFHQSPKERFPVGGK